MEKIGQGRGREGGVVKQLGEVVTGMDVQKELVTN